MSNSINKQPVKVGILEISAQNKAILEYFFSDAGKSYFKEVSLDKASAYIIDYDSLGAKESWKSTFEETKKPGIIISIKEVDLPFTIWLQKPLTVKALKEAGESIREMMLSKESAEPVTATVVEEGNVEALESVVDTPSESSSEMTPDDKELEDIINVATELPEESKLEEIEDIIELKGDIAEEDTQEVVFEDTIENDVLLTEDIIDIPSESISEIIPEEKKLEEINIATELLEESKLEETKEEEVVLEEALQIDNLLIDELVENPEEALLVEEESIEVSSLEEFSILEEQKEPELALAETSTSALSSDFATSNNFVDVDLSLDDAEESIDDNEVSTEQPSLALKTPVDEPELTNNNTEENEVDSLLESLISGGKSNKTVDNLDNNMSEDSADLLDIDLGTVEIENTKSEDDATDLPELTVTNTNIVEDDETSNKLQDDSLEVTATLDDVEIDKVLRSEEKIEIPEKTAEEELQTLLEEIRQEAEGTAPASVASSEQKSSTKRSPKYAPTNAQERWKLLCGNHKDTVGLKKLCSFDPSNHAISSLIENIKTSKQSKEIVRVKFKGIIVVIDPNKDRIYCDHSITTEFYANHCYETIDKDKIKIHQLDTSEMRLYSKKMEEDSERTHCTEAFVWTTSLLTSRGRLPNNTNLKSKIGLTAWPNLTRVETIPNMMQIAALFHKNTWNLSDLSNKSGIPKKHVVAFYNAALALDMIETDGVASSTPLDLKTGGNKNRSLFSRFLKKITA